MQRVHDSLQRVFDKHRLVFWYDPEREWAEAFESFASELKTPLMLRPCYHRADHRIRAHVMINVMAINCLRQMEHLKGVAAHDLRRLTQKVKAIEMQQGSHHWWQASELSDGFVAALRKLGIKQPPETWATWRELEG